MHTNRIVQSLVERMWFLGRFFLRPNLVGAVVPSSPYLVEELIKNMGVEDAHALAELGSGTGVVTKAILERTSPQASFLVIEKDFHLVQLLHKRYPDLDLIHGDAADLGTYIRERKLVHLDAVISGLPFSNFNEEFQENILDVVVECLKPGACFSTFAYVYGKDRPSGRRFRNMLNLRFDRVEVSDIIWRNTPPAVVYRVWKKA